MIKHLKKQSNTEFETALTAIDKIISRARFLEKRYEKKIKAVHPVYEKSAANLIHYLAFRSFDIDELQKSLKVTGLPLLNDIESHVMQSLYQLKNILSQLSGGEPIEIPKKYVTVKRASKIIRKNNKLLFGYKSKKRRTRIMVTLPDTSADDPGFVNKLVRLGMNCARINCAHDDKEAWLKMIQNVYEASRKQKKKCKIAMDLAGPKLRTGQMVEGPKVVHIRPKRNDLGQVIQPAKIWIAPPDVLPPNPDEANAILPVELSFCSKIKRGNTIFFTDTRGKKCKIDIEKKQGKGRWGLSSDSAYMETGMSLTLHKVKKSGNEVDRLGELLPKEQFLLLNTGDDLVLHKEDLPGENAKYDDSGQLTHPAHVSCTLGQIFKDVKTGEPIFFDDGKIEGQINKVENDKIWVKVQHTKNNGSKLKADKGINLPLSNLNVNGLTEKDREDLKVVSKYADAVNFSFVNSADDVKELYAEIDKYESKAGVILKIETQKAFSNLPSILLAAMRRFPVGVMIARGDLAIETGWKNFASIQQEILRICSAAHIPDVWATQVLESLAKKGTPSRSEITDAALAQQAECVMLNKGHYIHKAVKMLDRILRRMQRFQHKTTVMLPRLEGAEKLKLSHRAFDVE